MPVPLPVPVPLCNTQQCENLEFVSGQPMARMFTQPIIQFNADCCIIFLLESIVNSNPISSRVNIQTILNFHLMSFWIVYFFHFIWFGFSFGCWASICIILPKTVYAVERKEERAECLTNILHHLQQTDEQQQFLILLFMIMWGNVFLFEQHDQNYNPNTIQRRNSHRLKRRWKHTQQYRLKCNQLLLT